MCFQFQYHKYSSGLLSEFNDNYLKIAAFGDESEGQIFDFEAFS